MNKFRAFPRKRDAGLMRTRWYSTGSSLSLGRADGARRVSQSLLVMAISDVRCDAMVARQKLIKLFAFPASPAPGSKSLQTATKKFHNTRRRLGGVRPYVEDLQRCGREIAIGHDARLQEQHERNVVALSGLNHPITDFRAALFRPQTMLA